VRDMSPDGEVTLKLEKHTLETLVDVLNTVEFLKNYVNDQVISDISKLLGPLFKLLNAIASTDLIDVLERALQEPNLDKAIMDPPRVGMWGLLSALRNKEVQRGMGILIELLKAIGKAAMELK